MRVCSYNFKDKEEEFTYFFECDVDGNVINLPDDVDLSEAQYEYTGNTKGDISNESIENLIVSNKFVKLPKEYTLTNLEQ